MKIKTLLLSLIALAITMNATAQSTLTKENAQTYYAEFKQYFTDGTCSELALPYSAMTDDELRDSFGMSSVTHSPPASLLE